jgi:hypothetical protein
MQLLEKTLNANNVTIFSLLLKLLPILASVSGFRSDPFFQISFGQIWSKITYNVVIPLHVQQNRPAPNDVLRGGCELAIWLVYSIFWIV